jgi:transmembrane sensor
MTESKRIEEEAALWVVRHDDGPLTADDQREFNAWVNASSRHRGAFVRLNAVRVDLTRLTALSGGKLRDPALADDAPTSALDEIESVDGEGRQGRRISRRWAIAAGLASLAAGSSAWFTWRQRGEQYVSDIGELRQVSLMDGSNMTLNTATETRVHFSESAREVQVARGEALFEVATDRTRPFIVRAGDLEVTAIGTAFSVRVDAGRTDVTVTEGVVELARTGTSASAETGRRRLAANQRAIVTAARPVEVRAMEHAEAERRLAWRDGMVSFNGEPLAEAVAEVNRHNRRRIVVADPILAGRPVIGMFRANDIDTFARTAAAAMGAEAVADGDVIRLEAPGAQ